MPFEAGFWHTIFILKACFGHAQISLEIIKINPQPVILYEMKNPIQVTVFVLFTIFSMSCGKTTTISSNLELTGTWKLESIVQETDTIKKPNPSKGVMDVVLNFKEKGELEGNSSTNFLTGFYETAQQNTIQIGGGGTERAETPWGNMFINALPNVNLYDLKTNRLILYYENNNQMIFSRVQQ